MERCCRYSDCENQYRVATDDERVTCSLCREYMGLDPLEEEAPEEAPEEGAASGKVRVEDALNAVGMLIVMLLMAAEAGGMPEGQAREIHRTIMDAYCNLNMAAFEEMLLPDIIEKWVPMARPFARVGNYFGPEGNS